MGMCKGCKVVYSALIMKDGYCKDCKPELFSEEELKEIVGNEPVSTNTSKEELKNDELKSEPKPKSNMGLIIGGIILLIAGYFIYGILTQPSDEVVKNIASNYNVVYAKTTDINILKSYEEKGKLVYILNIKGMICEMPMLKVDDEWIATGIDCRG